MIEDVLKRGNVFKLVCGAGNEDVKQVEKLVTLYSLAGCEIFDVSANTEVIKAARKGIQNSGIIKDRYICVSFGIKGDMHVSKAVIGNQCIGCGNCISYCPQGAILRGDKFLYVDTKKCIGCSKCIRACHYAAITKKDSSKDLKELLPEILKLNPDCIELHASQSSEGDFYSKWEYIRNNFNGIQSLCIDRLKFGNEVVINRIKKLSHEGKKFIVQADGSPMSGGSDDYRTTLQAVATAEVIDSAKLPVYIVLSGGTNSKSFELSKLCSVSINGVAIGSYARKIVKEYIDRADFLSNDDVFNKALIIAKNLVNSVK